jgi:hypothetical protein
MRHNPQAATEDVLHRWRGRFTLPALDMSDDEARVMTTYVD